MTLDPGDIIALIGSILTLLTVVVTGVRVVSRTEAATTILQVQHVAIRESIDALNRAVGAQNGRISKLEVRMAVQEETEHTK
jgi:hypothetical protein